MHWVTQLLRSPDGTLGFDGRYLPIALIGLVLLSFIFLTDWLYSGRQHRWALIAAVGSLVLLVLIVGVIIASQAQFRQWE